MGLIKDLRLDLKGRREEKRLLDLGLVLRIELSRNYAIDIYRGTNDRYFIRLKNIKNNCYIALEEYHNFYDMENRINVLKERYKDK